MLKGITQNYKSRYIGHRVKTGSCNLKSDHKFLFVLSLIMLEASSQSPVFCEVVCDTFLILVVISNCQNGSKEVGQLDGDVLDKHPLKRRIRGYVIDLNC